MDRLTPEQIKAIANTLPEEAKAYLWGGIDADIRREESKLKTRKLLTAEDRANIREWIRVSETQKRAVYGPVE